MDEENPEKIIIDLDERIEQAIQKRLGVTSVCVLVDATGAKVELQSATETTAQLLTTAHASLDKLKGDNGKPEAPGYAG